MTGDRTAARRIVLADDHSFILEGISSVLSARPDLEIVATAANGIEAIAQVKTHRPDVAVFDYAMPGASGHEAFVEARNWSPDTRFIILTGLIAPQRFHELIEAGVDGILLKTMSADEICNGVERVLSGERVLSQAQDHLPDVPDAELLTGRERQVLEGIARGSKNAEIAEQLFVSVKTVESHRGTLMRKLEARNTATLLMHALRKGLIDA